MMWIFRICKPKIILNLRWILYKFSFLKPLVAHALYSFYLSLIYYWSTYTFDFSFYPHTHTHTHTHTKTVFTFWKVCLQHVACIINRGRGSMLYEFFIFYFLWQILCNRFCIFYFLFHSFRFLCSLEVHGCIQVGD